MDGHDEQEQYVGGEADSEESRDDEAESDVVDFPAEEYGEACADAGDLAQFGIALEARRSTHELSAQRPLAISRRGPTISPAVVTSIVTARLGRLHRRVIQPTQPDTRPEDGCTSSVKMLGHAEPYVATAHSFAHRSTQVRLRLI